MISCPNCQDDGPQAQPIADYMLAISLSLRILSEVHFDGPFSCKFGIKVHAPGGLNRALLHMHNITTVHFPKHYVSQFWIDFHPSESPRKEDFFKELMRLGSTICQLLLLSKAETICTCSLISNDTGQFSFQSHSWTVLHMNTHLMMNRAGLAIT